MPKTDHSTEITELRMANHEDPMIKHELAADLLEMHDRQSLSLDDWSTAKTFVEQTYRDAFEKYAFEVEKNGA